ncbi:hypothetical protein GB937_010729 [Aspergillus fischeri]|nr:hypothetical protein GB937_010729 [Aspergillus fischeri]
MATGNPALRLREGTCRWVILTTLLILILQVRAEGILKGHHHGGHRHVHSPNRHQEPSVSPQTPPPSTVHTSSSPHASAVTIESLDGAKQLVNNALRTLSVVNKIRLDHIQFNKYEYKTPVTPAKPAAPLDVEEAADGRKRRAANNKRRQDGNGTQTFTYSIPDELRQAARLVAETTPPAKPEGDHENIAAQIRKKYALRNNDTNMPPQKLRMPDGLTQYADGWEERGLPFLVNGNSTSAISSEHRNDDKDTIQQRDYPWDFQPAASITARGNTSASTEYWMVTMQQRGSSPFAPAGYKVWRNVKDYGAKGDGVADDTEAINKAISDGGRCGANCGSSTIYPAVVYFPPGTYLVSSSIIQYYNTQFLGDPHQVPTILAAASFVGLGVITSDVYISDNEQWYLNQNNFLRSIRNFKVDIRLTDPNAYVCAIHWQVAQGTSLENIEFYMLTGTTQQLLNLVVHKQGIYMENGSGGFLSDLTFVGGNFGHLVFVNCKTALQIHWDWAWTMQDVIIESCQTGIIIVGGAGGPMSSGQPVGSLLLADSLIANTPTGIITSLYAENSTSFLIQNTGFFNVKDAVIDQVVSKTLVAGGNEVFLHNWGFGMQSTKSGSSVFVNGQEIPTMNRTQLLLASDGYVNPNFFTRRRPKYHDIGFSQIMDVKAMGAKGDGVTDDAPVLNSILQNAANLSSIVYFPHGVYLIRDTLKVPTGSRIIGQAWSQIMATGNMFQDEMNPHVAVKVGEDGDRGIVEIQDMLFTVSGNTAGAVLMEWNVHESTQGSAGLWDSHFRVGGAIGSNLQAGDCPKLSGKVNPNCAAASLMLHLTPRSSAYLENIWVWVADHDLDIISQDQIDVYVARGILIESQGPTWLYGTASEHCTLYQYQLSGAKNLLLGMIQTESPYYQPTPKAPHPFTSGIFPNDPTFDDCEPGSSLCAFAWAVRIIDSKTVYMLGAGLYSWFNDYSQACLTTENCQLRGFEVEQSNDIWIYNLCTKAMIQMVTPVGELATLAADNRNGFLSSILAWVRLSSETVIGERNFTGFQIYNPLSSQLQNLTRPCVTALTQTIKCHDQLTEWQIPAYHGSLGDRNLTEAICDAGCGKSLKQWFDTVGSACAGQNITSPGGSSVATKVGGTIWAGYNETCLMDTATDEYCDGLSSCPFHFECYSPNPRPVDIIEKFTEVDTYEEMPQSELCSYCYVEKHRIMQSSPYSVYQRDVFYQSRLIYIYSSCPGETGPTDILPLPITQPPSDPISCFTEATYTTKAGDTCDSIAQSHSVASAALQMFNPSLLYNCTDVTRGLELCIPLTCDRIYILQPNDTCLSIEIALDMSFGTVRAYNPWIDFWCENLQSTTWTHGHILCLSPQAGYYNATKPTPGVVVSPGSNTGYATAIVPPAANATIASGTTPYCGRWYEVTSTEETCARVCVQNGITSDLFRKVNPSLASESAESCTGLLKVGVTYCVGPIYGWDSIVEDA